MSGYMDVYMDVCMETIAVRKSGFMDVCMDVGIYGSVEGSWDGCVYARICCTRSELRVQCSGCGIYGELKPSYRKG